MPPPPLFSKFLATPLCGPDDFFAVYLNLTRKIGHLRTCGPRLQNFFICQRHGLAVPRAGDRSYVTGSIRGWSRSHLTYLMDGC